MATYIILNLAFIGVMVLAFRIYTIPHPKVWLLTLIVLCILTALFDNLLIYFDIVTYDTSKLLGLYIGAAPIEDFFYCIFAALLIPTLWDSQEKNRA